SRRSIQEVQRTALLVCLKTLPRYLREQSVDCCQRLLGLHRCQNKSACREGSARRESLPHEQVIQSWEVAELPEYSTTDRKHLIFRQRDRLQRLSPAVRSAKLCAPVSQFGSLHPTAKPRSGRARFQTYQTDRQNQLRASVGRDRKRSRRMLSIRDSSVACRPRVLLEMNPAGEQFR